MEGLDYFKGFGCECSTLSCEDTLLLVDCAEESDAAAILIYEGLVSFLLVVEIRLGVPCFKSLVTWNLEIRASGVAIVSVALWESVA